MFWCTCDFKTNEERQDLSYIHIHAFKKLSWLQYNHPQNLGSRVCVSIKNVYKYIIDDDNITIFSSHDFVIPTNIINVILFTQYECQRGYKNINETINKLGNMIESLTLIDPRNSLNLFTQEEYMPKYPNVEILNLPVSLKKLNIFTRRIFINNFTPTFKIPYDCKIKLKLTNFY